MPERFSKLDDEIVEELRDVVGPDLKPLEPTDGVQRFLNRKQDDVTSNTIAEYQKKLSRFESFCERRDIDDLRELDRRSVDEYVSWLRHESSDEVEELSPKTMRDELYLIRQLLGYLERIDAVEPGLSEVVQIPDLSDTEGVRDVDVDPERVQTILEYLERYQYASLEHVVWLVSARVGRRLGGYVALDLCDAHLEGRDPYLEFRHRPPTRLKNGENGEEQVAIATEVADVLRDYIDDIRPEVTDDNGREPLLATRYGRISTTTFRKYIYKWSRPCMIHGDCPHDKALDDCEAAQSVNQAAKCPSSRSPHALRHGYISEARRRGVPLEVLTDRVDVTPEVIQEVYDESTPEERREVRRDILEEYTSDKGRGYL
ncbi:tyrosine-type recombinase/integrase [Halapricum salinum]|uniref:tyrosine-type recombinase/integrase n=1 Tax=Halapricum salinum TaxID=1457250 RepID=UPI0019298D4A|nr:site-specific integrase [Halapricum salinum]